ncbi:MAG: TorF family putative porin [Pseudomonadota bacterium]
MNRTCSAACFVLLWPLGAAAEESVSTVSGSASLATEYVFRGISQTEEKPQLRAQVTWSHDIGFYAGVWSANTHFGGPGNSIEIDPFIGFANAIGDSRWRYDFGYWYYHYPGARSDIDYGELYGILSYDLSPWKFQGSVWFAPDYFGSDFFDDEPATAIQGGATYAFGNGFSLSAMLGTQTFDEPGGIPGQDYLYWTIALAKSWDQLTFELVGHDTDGVEPELASEDISEERLVARIMIEF